jgi:uncharacterized protein with beta-barrel porin domain
MRINRVHLVGLAVALAGVGGNAQAGDLTISTATTTPVATSNPDGTSTPGNITVASGGSITVTAGQTAVTVNSSNSVSNSGTISSNNANNTTAILLVGGNTGSVTSSGTISLVEDHTITDTDNDGDLDGEFAVGLNRYGIRLQSGPTFTGNISNTGAIAIEGEQSAAMRLDALLTGNLTSSGAITVTGDDSYGVQIGGGAAGGVTGDVTLTGAMTVRGENSNGLLVGAPIGGGLNISGVWNVTGYRMTTPPPAATVLEPNDTAQSGAAIAVHFSVADGVTLRGIGAEDDDDDDGDGELNEVDDNAAAAIAVFGSSPAVLVQADPSANLVLGANSAGFGLQMRGSITAAGTYRGFSATGIRVQGAGGASSTVTGGASIEGILIARALEADAYGVVVGNDGVMPQILVRGSTTASVNSDAARNAYGILLEAGANVPAIVNSGTIAGNYFGETGNANAIVDRSGSLTSITNSGVIAAAIVATDDNPADNVPPPPVTGSAIAIDVSAATAGVVVEQRALATPFTDDDATDDVTDLTPAIRGDVRFGGFNDTLNLLAGSIRGDVSFGNGADVFTVNNGATFTGSIRDLDGNLTINVVNGALNLEGSGLLNITSATFGANADLNVALSVNASETTNIVASGTVTFLPGAAVTMSVPVGLPDFGAQAFLTANGGMFGAANVVGPVTGTGAPFIYNTAITLANPLAADGAPNALMASFDLKTAAELGLNTNQASAYTAIVEALRRDADAAAAMTAIETQSGFFDAYADLMPNYAPGATELAATAIQQMQSATSNRMAATRLQGLDEVSLWGQEIAYGLDRQPATVNSQAFSGQGFGFAGGIDGPTDNGGLFGLSASFIASEAEEEGRPDGEISMWLGQANAYYGTALGPIDLDFVVGLGAGKMQSRRFVEIGSGFRAVSEAEWIAYEGHGAIRASAPLAASDWFVITPQVALTYIGLNEEGYAEEGGGAAIDQDVDTAFSQRLWGDVGVEFATRWRWGANGVFAPRLYAGYRGNLLDEETERTVRFVSGGPAFTLTDEGVGEGGPLVGLGFDATNGYSTISIGYEGELGDQVERHSLNAAIRFRF